MDRGRNCRLAFFRLSVWTSLSNSSFEIFSKKPARTQPVKAAFSLKAR
jgi:hypothetical protein